MRRLCWFAQGWGPAAATRRTPAGPAAALRRAPACEQLPHPAAPSSPPLPTPAPLWPCPALPCAPSWSPCMAAGTWGSYRWGCRARCAWARAARCSSVLSSPCRCRWVVEGGRGGGWGGATRGLMRAGHGRGWGGMLLRRRGAAQVPPPAATRGCVAPTRRSAPLAPRPAQVDGEPWVQAPAALRITRRNQGLVLRRVHSKPLGRMMQASGLGVGCAGGGRRAGMPPGQICRRRRVQDARPIPPRAAACYPRRPWPRCWRTASTGAPSAASSTGR